MDGASRGGNDTLTAGAGGGIMHGDAFQMSGDAIGGRDTLISGPGTDHMWGDAQEIDGVGRKLADSCRCRTVPAAGQCTGRAGFMSHFHNGAGKCKCTVVHRRTRTRQANCPAREPGSSVQE